MTTQNTQKPGDKNTPNKTSQNQWTTTAGGHQTGKDNDKSRKQTTKGDWQNPSTGWNASPAGSGKTGSVNKNK